MKKIVKWGAILLGVFAVLLIGAAVAFKIMFPPEKIKTIAQGYAKEYLGREITFDSVSFRLIGISLDNFAMSEASTFEAGTFASAKSVVAKVALLPLLKKDIQISTIGLEGFSAGIIKNESGSFNFDDITERFAAAPEGAAAPAAEDTASSAPLNLSIDNFYIKDSNISFTDNQSKMKAEINDININIDEFKMNGDFIGTASMQIKYDDGSIKADVPLSAQFGANLADMDLDKASAALKTLTAEYNGMKVSFSGNVKGFNNPAVEFKGLISGLTNKTIKDFAADVPAFALPDINFSTVTNISLDNSSADVKSFKTNVKNSTMDMAGTASWAKDLAYNFKVNFHLVLSELGQIAPDMLKGFNISDLAGTVDGGVTLKQNDVKGTVSMAGAGMAYKPVAEVKNVNGKIEVLSMTSVKANGITGMFNDGKFTSDFAFKELKKDFYDLNLNLDLASLTIKELPASAAVQPAGSAPAGAQTSASAASAAGPKFNVTATAKVGKISVPFFVSDGATLTAKLTDVDSTLHTINGETKFDVAQSTITDLDQFVNSNRIAKITFTALKVVREVAGILKLDLFKDTTDSTQPKGLHIASMTGDYNFVKGLMTIKDTSVNSSVSTIKASGTADFKTEALNMRASATIIAKQPVVMKISGTMTNPKGSLDVVSTAVSIIPGVTGTSADAVKAVATNATGAVKSVVDIFKKK